MSEMTIKAGDVMTVRVKVHQGPNANGVLWCDFVNAKGRVVKPKANEHQGVVAVPPEAIVKHPAECPVCRDVGAELQRGPRLIVTQAGNINLPETVAKLVEQLAAAGAECEALQTENDYLFQLLSPENKVAYLERLGISRERQDAARKRVQDALAARAKHDAARGGKA